jgi:hypothetical protein
MRIAAEVRHDHEALEVYRQAAARIRRCILLFNSVPEFVSFIAMATGAVPYCKSRPARRSLGSGYGAQP